MDIKLAIFDLDGVLTDGMYSVSEDGHVSKTFYTRDWWALQWLQEHGIDVIILTHCYDKCIDEKINGMPDAGKKRLKLVKLDWSRDKDDWLDILVNFPNPGFPDVSFESIAFMGDGENDVEAMKLCGLTACPSDAVSIVKNESNFVAESPGGRGAVYEFVKYIIDKKAKDVFECDRQNNQASNSKPNESS